LVPSVTRVTPVTRAARRRSRLGRPAAVPGNLVLRARNPRSTPSGCPCNRLRAHRARTSCQRDPRRSAGLLAGDEPAMAPPLPLVQVLHPHVSAVVGGLHELEPAWLHRPDLPVGVVGAVIARAVTPVRLA